MGRGFTVKVYIFAGLKLESQAADNPPPVKEVILEILKVCVPVLILPEILASRVYV